MQMISLNTILSVAKYERVLLSRSWFFRIFAFLSIAIIGIYTYVPTSSVINVTNIIYALPSTMPYMSMLLLNVGQAVIAIFLASEFIKRDQKLDTSEVFFVKPMSNTEYVLGKTLGSIQMFMFISIITVLMTYIFNRALDWVDYKAYLYYIFLINIPTLVYIIGLSYFLMVLIRNQAIVFALLLGYVALTVFYIGDYFYYVFDYMGFNLPLVKSDIVGMSNIRAILLHRCAYLLIGSGLIGLSIYRLNRLPNRKLGRYYVLAFSLLILGCGFSGIFAHIYGFNSKESKRELYLSLNNKYSRADKLLTDKYDIKVIHRGDVILSEAKVSGKTMSKTSELIFTLNPDMIIDNVTCEEYKMSFERQQQIVRVIFEEPIDADERINLSFIYNGGIDQSFCYLDIEKTKLNANKSIDIFNVDKQYAFLQSDYVLLTPETYWYPRPGTSYSDENPNWQQTYFADYTLEVSTADSLKAISQGECVFEDGKYLFKPENKMLYISLAIGKYKEYSRYIDKVDYSIAFIDGHDNFSAITDSIMDTIPGLIKNGMISFQQSRGMGEYPFKRFRIVEVPAQFAIYDRMWTQASESVQPEIVFFEERGYNTTNVSNIYREQKQWQRWSNNKTTDEELRIRATDWTIRKFTSISHIESQKVGGKRKGVSVPNPYNILPNFLNYRINIYSPEWLIGNRIIEQYIMPNDGFDDYFRTVNGISVQEQSNIILKDYSFRYLVSDNKYNTIKSELINVKAKELFQLAEMNASAKDVKKELFKTLEKSSFNNISFEELLDSVGRKFSVDMNSYLSFWMDSVSVPVYETLEPVFENYKNRDEDVYVTTVNIKNISEHKGLIYLEMREGKKRNTPYYFYVEPGQRVQRVIYSENPPAEVVIDTNISGNIPNRFSFKSGKIATIKGSKPQAEGLSIIEDDYVDENVIIVDNEDEGFSVTDDKKVGYLAHWLNTDPKSETKYSGLQYWRPPLTWINVPNNNYYGKTIRSAAAVKSGDGSKYANWSTEIKEERRYELYYYTSEPDYMRWDKRADAKYQFVIESYNDAPDLVFLDIRKAGKGWCLLGTYYLNAGECNVKLSNKAELRIVEADAVKFVKR